MLYSISIFIGYNINDQVSKSATFIHRPSDYLKFHNYQVNGTNGFRFIYIIDKSLCSTISVCAFASKRLVCAPSSGLPFINFHTTPNE